MKFRIAVASLALALTISLTVPLAGCNTKTSNQPAATSSSEPTHFKAGDLDIIVAHS